MTDHPTGIDAYKPAEIEQLVENAGIAKARLGLVQMFTLAVLAGAFIAMGAAAYTMVMSGTVPGFGPARFLGGIVFSLGLILVVIAGAELFTGNALMIIAAVDRKISIAEMGRAWGIVYVGNFVGAIGMAVLFAYSGTLAGASETAMKITAGKLSLPWDEALIRAILCNIFVCLAVWLALAARTVMGKILAIIWPIASFVMLGLEHSIANMYLIPQGFFAGAAVDIPGMAGNLFWVTLGNIIGGAGGVGLAYRLAYGKKS